jgi:hypothetical protein
MGVYWLEAEESAAAAIARSESRGVYDWPSLSMAGLQHDELATLWAVLRGAPGDRAAATGDLLASDDVRGIAVARVSPAFVHRLAALEGPDIERAAAAWANSGGFTGYPREFAAIVLRELASFAGSAWYEGSSVLQVADDL